MRRYLVVVVAVFAATTTVPPLSWAASKTGPDGPIRIADQPPGGFASWDEVFAVQDKVNAAAERISAARDGSRDAGPDDGFAGFVAAPEHRRLQLYWRGPVPPKVHEAIKLAEQDAPVEVAEAANSEQELLGHGDAILPSAGVSGVSPKPDGNGLTVSVTGSAEEGRRIPAVAAAKVPVTVKPFVRVEPVFNRQRDITPYWGGARYSTPGGYCSTGFGMRRGDRTLMLTAGHCGEVGQTATDGNGLPMGKIVSKNPPSIPRPWFATSALDVMLIEARSGTRVFTGPTSSNTSLPVYATADSYVGNYVCTSGSFTGTNCPLRVEDVSVAIQTDVGRFYPMVQAASIRGKTAVGTGDSGGPVMSNTWLGGAAGSTAKGTISAGSGELGPCQLSRRCFTTVYYAGITTTLFRYGIFHVPPIEIMLSPRW